MDNREGGVNLNLSIFAGGTHGNYFLSPSLGLEKLFQHHIDCKSKREGQGPILSYLILTFSFSRAFWTLEILTCLQVTWSFTDKAAAVPAPWPVTTQHII